MPEDKQTHRNPHPYLQMTIGIGIKREGIVDRPIKNVNRQIGIPKRSRER